jgi:hypothetical protein
VTACCQFGVELFILKKPAGRINRVSRNCADCPIGMTVTIGRVGRIGHCPAEIDMKKSLSIAENEAQQLMGLSVLDLLLGKE